MTIEAWRRRERRRRAIYRALGWAVIFGTAALFIVGLWAILVIVMAVL